MTTTDSGLSSRNGGEVGDGDGQLVDLVHPGIVLLEGGVDGPERPPDGAVALEAGAENNLPDAVPLLDSALHLRVGELVPERAAGRVPEAVERHARRLQVPLRQLQLLLDLVEHTAPPRVDAKVV